MRHDARTTSGKRLAGAAPLLARAFIVALLVACPAGTLAGCRYSDVLTEHVWQAGAEIDDSMPPSYKNVDEATPMDFQSYKRSHSDSIDEQEYQIPSYADLPTEVQESIKSVHEESTLDRGEASQGTQTGSLQDTAADNQMADGDQGSKAGSGDGAGADSTSAYNPFRASASNTTDTQEEPSTSDEAQSTNTPKSNQQNQGSEPTDGNGGTGQVYNDGTYTNLPQNTHKVAAVGQYALIVQMLAGEGALVAADEEWLGRVRASGAFPGEGLNDVAVGWSGNGRAAGSADVQAIIAAKPDVVLAASNFASVTQGDADALRQAGISVVVMPALDDEYSLDADVVTAVRVVGELLKNAGTAKNSRDMANSYVGVHDQVLEGIMSRNGGYTTVLLNYDNYNWLYQGSNILGGPATPYLSSTRYAVAYAHGWDPDGPWAPSTSHVESRAWNDHLVYPNVTGSPYQYTDGYWRGQCSVDTIGGFATLPSRFTTESTVPVSRSVYPLIDYYLQHSGAMDSDLITTLWVHWGPRDVTHLYSNALWFEQQRGGARNFLSPGEAEFPGIIARSSDVAQRLKASGEKENGYYNFGLPYKVWVTPEGLAGDWADGTVESFLVAPWMYGVLQNGGDTSEASSLMEQFYNYFYRCSYDGVVRDYGNTIYVNCPNATPDNRYQESSTGGYWKTPGVLHGELTP